MRIGAALHCESGPRSFHRKNYFYPDMPKDYQISQYDEPINVDGWLELPDGTRVGIERAHMEEDTGKTTHVGGGGRIHDADHSLVDYNRAGVPLVEIVCEPDIRSAAQARAYVAELRAILVATGASDGRMEEGSLRVDANVSVRPTGAESSAPAARSRTSTRCARSAGPSSYEAARQIAAARGGRHAWSRRRATGTRTAGRTVAMRSKEEAYDYRYFPEPDLVPLVPGREWQAQVAAALGPDAGRPPRAVLPRCSARPTDARRQTDQIATVVDLGLDGLVTAAVGAGAPARAGAGPGGQRGGGQSRARPAARPAPTSVAAAAWSRTGKLSATQAKAVLADLLENGGDPAALAADMGFEAFGLRVPRGRARRDRRGQS